jgi:hypothetical protein
VQTLREVAEAARHGLASHIDNCRFGQHEMDESDVTKAIRHLVDEEWLVPPVCARVRHVALAEGAEIFRNKFG